MFDIFCGIHEILVLLNKILKMAVDKGTTNYKLLGAYVAKIIGYSTTDFFFKNSLSLNIPRIKEDSTVRKYNLKKFAGRCCWKKLLQRRINLKKMFAEENFLSLSPSRIIMVLCQ